MDGNQCPLSKTCLSYGNTNECLIFHSDNLPLSKKYTECSIYAQEKLKAENEENRRLALAHAQQTEEEKGSKESLTVLPESLRSNPHDHIMMHPEIRSGVRPQPVGTIHTPLNEAQRRRNEVREQEKQEWQRKMDEANRKTKERETLREMENLNPADKIRKILGIETKKKE